jgi:type IV pilus assembly protein PilO
MSIEEVFSRVTKLQRTLIIAAVAVLLLVAFYFLVIADMRSQIDALEQQIGKIKIEITNQESVLREGPKLKQRIEDLREELQQRVALLPEKQDIEVLLKKITDLLSESRVVATKFVPGKEEVNQELYYAKIPIQLSITGDYQKLLNFLASLNKLPRIVNVPVIKLTKSAATGGREGEVAKKLEVVTLDAAVNGETYRRLSPEEVKAIPKGKPGAKPGAKAPARGKSPSPAPTPEP